MPVNKIKRTLMEQMINEVKSLIYIYGDISDSLKTLQSQIKDLRDDYQGLRNDFEELRNDVNDYREEVDDKMSHYQIEEFVYKKLLPMERKLNDLLNWYNKDRELKYKIL